MQPAAAAAATASQPATDLEAAAVAAAPPVVHCQLTLSGHDTKPGVASAQMQCSRGNVNVTIHPALEQFRANFRGVELTDCQLYQKCLVAICGDAQVDFDAPSIKGLMLQGFADGEQFLIAIGVCINSLLDLLQCLPCTLCAAHCSTAQTAWCTHVS
jgi:hypothetical protein